MLYEVSNTLLKTPYSGTSDQKKELCVKMIHRLTALINAESLKKNIPRMDPKEYNDPSSYSLEALEREVWLYVQTYSRILDSPSIPVVPDEPSDDEEEPIYEPKTATGFNFNDDGDWVDPDGLWTYTRTVDRIYIRRTTGKTIPDVLDYSDMPYEVLKVDGGKAYEVTSYADLLSGSMSTNLIINNWTNMYVENMSDMFSGCTNLMKLSLSNFDTSSVTSMSNMFRECSSLTSLDLSSFDTSNVTDMSDMFSGCTNLMKLSLSNFDTSNVETMRGMFYGCTKLTSLDVSSFDTSNVTDMINMFYNCSSLESLNLTSFDISGIGQEYLRDMFPVDNEELRIIATNELAIRFINIIEKAGYATFKGYTYNVYRIIPPNRIPSFATTSKFDKDPFADGNEWTPSKHIWSYTLSENGIVSVGLADTDTVISGLNYSDMPYEALQVVEDNSVTKTYKITSYSEMFNENNSTDITISNWTNMFVTDMSFMFSECSKLESLNLINFNTSNVIYMSVMFYGCSSLKNLDLSSFNTNNVTDMTNMFYNCSSLTDLNLSSFDTSSVTNMASMFGGCSSLKNLNLRSFNTGNVAYMNYMFNGCINLESLDLSSFNTNSVIYINRMFYGCSSLKNLNLRNFNTSKVTDLSYLFNDCFKLESLSLNGWNTKLVDNMSYMFNNCSSLTSLDLSSFNTSKVTDMSNMFNGCSSLETLNLINFDTSKVSNTDNMFFMINPSVTITITDDAAKKFSDMLEKVSENTYKIKTNGGFPAYYKTATNVSFADNVYSEGLWTYTRSGDDIQVSLTAGKNILSVLDYDDMPYEVLVEVMATDTNDDSTEEILPTVYAINSYSSLFEGKNITALTIRNWTNNNVTDMSNMFNGCSSLTNLNIRGFGTNRVTNMSRMFASCSSLTSLNLSSFNTSNVTNMSFMFDSCFALTELNLSSFNTSNVTNMRDMFRECSSLTSLDLNNFNTSNIENMSSMFAECEKLTNLDLSSFNTSSVTDMSSMFYGCSSLMILDMNDIAIAEGTDLDNMLSGINPSVTITINNTAAEQLSDILEKVGENTYTVKKMHSGVPAYTKLARGVVFSNEIWTDGLWKYTQINSNMISAIPVEGAKIPSELGYSDMPYELLIDEDGNELKTVSYVPNTYVSGQIIGMFSNNTDITALSIRNWTNKYVTNMSCMFAECSNLKTLSLSNFYTGNNSIDMSHMFYNCSSLTSLDLNNFNTSIVSDMSSMFNGCSSLESLDLSSFKTSGVTDMSYMFAGCSALASLTGNFNTGFNLTNMSHMFYNCSSLTTLTLGENFIGSNVSDMRYMFAGCGRLEDLSSIKLKPTRVSYISCMFSGCHRLKTLSLKDWNMTPSVDMSYMLAGCGSMTSLDLSTLIVPSMAKITGIFGGINPSVMITINEKAAGEFADMIEPVSGQNYYTIKRDSNGVPVTTNTAVGISFSNDEWTDSSSIWTYRMMPDNVIYVKLTHGVLVNQEVLDYSEMPYEMFIIDNDTIYVTAYDELFKNNTDITTLAIRNWSNKYVTGISSLFNGCTNLKTLDLSGFRVRNINDADSVFSGCKFLTSLDLSSWDTSNATTMIETFSGCSALTSLDLSSWNTSKVTTMIRMFNGCMQSIQVDTTAILTLSASFWLEPAALLSPPKKVGNPTTPLPLQITCNDSTYSMLGIWGEWTDNLKWEPAEWEDEDKDGLCTFVIDPV